MQKRCAGALDPVEMGVHVYCRPYDECDIHDHERDTAQQVRPACAPDVRVFVAASIRKHVVSRPHVLTWLRRTFAGAFAALGAKLALVER